MSRTKLRWICRRWEHCGNSCLCSYAGISCAPLLRCQLAYGHAWHMAWNARRHHHGDGLALLLGTVQALSLLNLIQPPEQTSSPSHGGTLLSQPLTHLKGFSSLYKFKDSASKVTSLMTDFFNLVHSVANRSSFVCLGVKQQTKWCLTLMCIRRFPG